MGKSGFLQTIVGLTLLFSPAFINAGNQSESFGVAIGGFIKSDFFYDTRQTVAAREGHFLLWPAKPSYDQEGVDINGAPSINFLSIQTRANLAIRAPETFGVKTSGFIEGAFFGHSNTDINGFRLRHAFVKFEWSNRELLFGQFWNPLFVTASFPDVVSFNTGCPFQAFSRNPQIRYTRYFGQLSLMAAALSQRDFSNVGPLGASSEYLRNAAFPDIHLQANYHLAPEGQTTMLLVGGGMAYKKIVPSLVTTNGYKSDAGVNGLTYMAFAKATFSPVTIKAQYLMGQNVTDLLMMGGYGISGVADPAKAILEFAPLQTRSIWIELHTNGKIIQYGLFGGLSENLGATKDLLPSTTTTGLGNDIKTLYRIAPRLVVNSGRARFALECEYTNAKFGVVNISQNRRGIPVNTTQVGNLRLLLGVYLFF